MLRRAVANQIYRRFRHFRQIGCLTVTVDMHVKDAWTLKEEVIVNSRHLESVIKQGGHYWIHFVFKKHQVAHHHVHATVALGHCEPASEAEWRRRSNPVNRYL